MLVGGEGTRLRPLTFCTPKQLLPIAGRSMLERVLEPLAAAGIEEVGLSLGYQPHAFRERFPDAQAGGLRLRYVVEPEPLGTGGGIRFAARGCGMDGETIVVHNGDVLTGADLSALVSFHHRSGAKATLALTEVEDPSAFGVVVTDAVGRVSAFVEKPPRHEAPSKLVSAGTYVFDPAVLEMIPPGRAVSIEREVFPRLAEEGSLFGLAQRSYWIDAGTPEKYVRANLDCLVSCGEDGPVPGAKEAAPGVWSLEGVTAEGAVEGRCLLLEGATVKPGALVQDCVVGEAATIGRGATVRRSVLLAGASVGEGALVEDSIIGPGGVVGPGARVAAWSVIGNEAAVPGATDCVGGRVAAGSVPGEGEGR